MYMEAKAEGAIVDRWSLHCTTIYPFYLTEAFSLDCLATATREALALIPEVHAEKTGMDHFGKDDSPVPVALLRSWENRLWRSSSGP